MRFISSTSKSSYIRSAACNQNSSVSFPQPLMYMGFIHLFLDPSLRVPSYMQIKGTAVLLPFCRDAWSSSASICSTFTPFPPV